MSKLLSPTCWASQKAVYSKGTCFIFANWCFLRDFQYCWFSLHLQCNSRTTWLFKKARPKPCTFLSPELAYLILTCKIGSAALQPVTETGYYQSFQVKALWVHLSWSHMHSLGKQFILCHKPRRIVNHHLELTIQLVQHFGNRCNRPSYATLIPMTVCSLPFYHGSPLYKRHIKCSNTQREIAWLKYALTHKFLHIRLPTHQ